MKNRKISPDDRDTGGLIFSAAEGQVWANWRDGGASVKLGQLAHVVEMMRDFIAQTEIGERLLKGAAKGAA